MTLLVSTEGRKIEEENPRPIVLNQTERDLIWLFIVDWHPEDEEAQKVRTRLLHDLEASEHLRKFL